MGTVRVCLCFLVTIFTHSSADVGLPPAIEKIIRDLVCKELESGTMEADVAKKVCGKVHDEIKLIPEELCEVGVKKVWEREEKKTCANNTVAVPNTVLKLTWNDCSDSTYKGKITGFSPASLTLGSTTTVTGTGTVNEPTSGGSFEIDMKAAIFSKKWTGDLCAVTPMQLPLGTGSLTWKGLKCPQAAGPMNVPVDIMLQDTIPPALQTATFTIKLTGSNGDKLACLSLQSSPGAESFVVV